MNLIKNIEHIQYIDKKYTELQKKAYKKKLTLEQEIDKIHYERQFQSYGLYGVDPANVKVIKNITNMEAVIGATKSYYAEKRRDKNKPNAAPGMWVTPAMQVIDAYQNLTGNSYRNDMHTRNVLANIIEKGTFKYNTKVFKRYGLTI